jgi:hypothetical protein
VEERVIHVGKKGFDLGGRINLDLKPGIYELHITIKDPKSPHLAQARTLFEIVD